MSYQHQHNHWKGLPIKRFHTDVSDEENTKKIRRLTSIFNPVVKNFVNPTEIKESATVN